MIDMIILGVPADTSKYYMADGEIAFRLQQMGFSPKFKDEECLYFRINSKLLKVIEKLERE